MASNTQVAADAHAPPVTRILAEFVATHPVAGLGRRDRERGAANVPELARLRDRRIAPRDGRSRAVRRPRARAGRAGRRSSVATSASTSPARRCSTASRRTRSISTTRISRRSFIRPVRSHRPRSRSPSTPARAGASSSTRWSSASTSPAASATRSIRNTTIAAGTSPARRGCWARPRRAHGCCASTADQTTMALGLAASQPVGVREQFGTMTKPFHPGAAARAGLTSALMAKHGFTASARALEAPRGLMQTYSTRFDWNEITDALGQRFEISFNTYKPFACGIVIHPSIDGCVQLRRCASARAATTSPASTSSFIRWCSSSPERPRREPGSKASSASTTRAPPASCSDRRARPSLRTPSWRDPMSSPCASAFAPRADATVAEDAADITVTCTDGRRLHLAVAHAIGSLERPMTDADLERKFHGLVDPVLGAARAGQLIDACASLARAERRAHDHVIGDAVARTATSRCRAPETAP